MFNRVDHGVRLDLDEYCQTNACGHPIKRERLDILDQVKLFESRGQLKLVMY